MQELFYDISKIQNMVQFESMLKAVHDKSESGESQVDDTAINDKDLVFIKKILKTAADKVFGVLEPYSRTVHNLFEKEPYEFDVIYETLPGHIVYRVVWPEKFPVTSAVLVDGAIENYLISSCKAEFRLKKGLNNQSERSESETNYSNLLSFINRRSGLKRTYKLF